jgi:hypothetical protein
MNEIYTKQEKLKGLMSLGMDFHSSCMMLGYDSNDPEIQSVRFFTVEQKDKPKFDLPPGFEDIFGFKK